MLKQYIVYGTFGAICIEDDSEHGAACQALENCEEPQEERVTCVKEVNVCNYPY